MSAEGTLALVERAAVHAALGDPARLRIADTLLVGDAAPSELADLLGVPSNLLAHHLNVLEEAGLITRRRSEGDARRTYVRLARGVLARAGPSPLPAPERVVFVCTANSARSHLAAALWRRSIAIPGVSAGTHPADVIDPGAIAAAARHGLRLPRVRPRHLADVEASGDFVVTVCDRAHEEIGAKAAAHWSVPDPVRAGTVAAYDGACEDLSARVSELARLVSTPA